MSIKQNQYSNSSAVSSIQPHGQGTLKFGQRMATMIIETLFALYEESNNNNKTVYKILRKKVTICLCSGRSVCV